MADPLIVKEWLEKADEDFRFAEASLKGGSEFYAQICFHFQQSAEKYLKAFIIGKGLAFEKVHDLVHLLRTCATFEPAFAALFDHRLRARYQVQLKRDEPVQPCCGGFFVLPLWGDCPHRGPT